MQPLLAECSGTDLAPRTDSPRAVYIHVPYCRRVCPYCAFAVHALHKPGPTIDQFSAALCEEIRLRGESCRISSLYFGGGTPSLVDAANFARILEALRSAFDLTRLREFTVEANPEDIDRARAEELRALGVNRVSLGAQSFDSKNLRLLGRRHSSAGCAMAVAHLRAAGIEHINLDLIIGVPGQSEQSLRDDLEQLVANAIDHVSCYMLTYESGTPFERQRIRGSLSAIDDDTVVHYYRIAHRFLCEREFQHYEVSNFARPGHRCRQNATYWARRSYFGFGPSAASCRDGVRRRNHSKLSTWYSHVMAGRDPAQEVEALTRRQRFLEALMLGLRCSKGLNWSRLRREFGADLPEFASTNFQPLVEEKILRNSSVSLRPTLRGFELADSLAENLLNDRDPDRR